MKTHKSLMVSCLSVLSITLFVQHAQAAAAFDPNGLGCWVIGTVNAQRYKHKVMIFLLDIPVNMPVF
jgi:porin